MCMVMTHSVVAAHAHLIPGNPFGVAFGEAFFFFQAPWQNAQRKCVKLTLHLANMEYLFEEMQRELECKTFS